MIVRFSASRHRQWARKWVRVTRRGVWLRIRGTVYGWYRRP